MRNIALFGESLIAELLAAKLQTLPETRVIRGRFDPADQNSINVAIICERSRSSQLWQTQPLLELTNQLGYLYNAFWSVQAYEIPHLITIGSANEYAATVAPPYAPELMWDGWPDGGYRGVMLRVMEVLVRAYNEVGRLGHHIVLDSLYGADVGYDEFAPLIPALIHRCTEAVHKNLGTVVVNSDGKASRTFLHYEDAVEGILAVMNNGEHHPGIINHGGDQQIAVDKLATIIKNFVGFTGEIVYDPSQPGGREESSMDCSILHNGIGFKPVKRLLAGLEEATRTYRDNYRA